MIIIYINLIDWNLEVGEWKMFAWNLKVQKINQGINFISWIKKYALIICLFYTSSLI